MLSQPVYPLLTAEAFLGFDFAGLKAELDNGAIQMVSGATERHAWTAGNILDGLRQRLHMTGFAAYGSIMPVCTHAHSVRFPDVSVYRAAEIDMQDHAKAFDDPRVIFEVLSAGTARTDLRVKLDEYRKLPSVDTIVFVDIASERLRVVQRTGPSGWADDGHGEPIDLALPSLNIVVPHEEIFARD